MMNFGTLLEFTLQRVSFAWRRRQAATNLNEGMPWIKILLRFLHLPFDITIRTA